MRIGIMLRSIDEKGGIGVYSRYITEELLDLDSKNDYFLLYKNRANVGRFSHYQNATEVVVEAPNKAFWDQLAIPYACWRHKIDVLFHPKFTVPLLAPSKSVMVLHGAGWFMPEHSRYWDSMDLRYLRLMMPVYCRRAASVIAVSKITADTFYDVFNLPAGKIKPVYFGPGKHFKRVEQPEILEQVRQKYALPEQYILTLTGYDRGPRKNIGGVLQAYQEIHGRVPHKLVIGGKDCYKFREDFAIPESGYGADILFPDWIDQEDLPAIYSMADLFLYPSWVEAFPIPITEALACGTPIVTSNANGMKELADGAAFLVDPANPKEIAAAIEQVLGDEALRRDLQKKGLERSERFSWGRCARETLAILEAAAS